jgi:putative ABC transport system permease protein
VNLFRTFAVALTALARTKTRSLLTMLGVIIGVGAVIAMVSIGEGAKARVSETFQAMGTSTLVVSGGAARTAGVRGGGGSRMALTWDDLAAIAQMPEVSFAAPQLRANAQIVGEEGNWQTSVYGTTPEWFDIREWKVVKGDPLSAADVQGRKAVAVIGQTIVDNLFPSGADPIGQTIRINRAPFTVIGVLDKKGTSAFGSDNDDQIVVPSTTYVAKVGGGGLAKFIPGQILVSAAQRGKTADTKLALEELLRRSHKIREGDEDDFNVRDMAEIAAASAESTEVITKLLFGVALVSLLVGGIGIMNIMLVSVTERTREIGLRMAIGAKGHHVLTQFLIEAVVLSVVGGMFGIVAGIVAAKYLAIEFGFPLLVRFDIVALAVVVSAAVGIVFGLFPARKASALDPITALRYE